MQVVPFKTQILHQTFLGVKNSSQTLFINGQSLSKYGQMPWEFQEVIFFRKEKPIINDGTIEIEGVGELKADVEIKNNTYYIYLEN